MNYSHIKQADSTKELEHDCSKYIELRSRDKGTGIAYAYQCQFCGEFRGQEVSKQKVKSIPPFADLKLQGIYQQKSLDLSNKDIQLTSIEQNTKSLDEKISEINKIINDYCHENRVDPKLFIPTYLTKQRESHINNNYQSNWHNEPELCTWFHNTFSQWFEVYPEVPGTGYIDRKQKNLRIDFIIKAKEELLNHGFTNQYIGIEVKYLSPLSGDGFHGKSSRGIFQALSYWYSGARWQLPDHKIIELASVLIFSNLSFNDEANFIFDTMDSHYRKVWRSYLSIANHANIGELSIQLKQNQLISWSMDYSSTRYYSMHRDRGFTKGNSNVINKNRIGSQR